MPEDEKLPDDNVLWHQSGVNPRGEPFIQLLRGTEIVCQMDTAQARDHARAVLEAAEAAEQDAFIMAFGQHKLGLGFNEAGSILIALREYRAALTGKSQGPTNKRDWVMPPPGKTPDYGDFTKKDPRK